MSFEEAKWIWKKDCNDGCILQFKTQFFAESSIGHSLYITAETRYVVYINGKRLGSGPPRAYPFDYRYDRYDLDGAIKEGSNIIAVLVVYSGESSLQHIEAAPGLKFAITDSFGKTIVLSDKNVLVREDCERKKNVPFVSHQQLFKEEHYDAARYDGWMTREDGGGGFENAVVSQAAAAEHAHMRQSDIKHVGGSYILPKRIAYVEGVRSNGSVFALYTRKYVLPKENASMHFVSHFYWVLEAESDTSGEFALNYCEGVGFLYINGQPFTGAIGDKVYIRQGLNKIVLGRKGVSYANQNVFNVSGVKLKLEKSYFIGPLGLGIPQEEYPESEWGETYICSPVRHLETEEIGFIEKHTTAGDYDKVFARFPEIVRDVTDELEEGVVFHESLIDEVVKKDLFSHVADEEYITTANGFVTVFPDADCDVRLLLDYGGEYVGYQSFECVAHEGVVLDFHNFEFIQPDGRRNYAETMNNSFRYVCRDGYQTFTCIVPKGFRFSYLTIRGQKQAIKLRNICVEQCIYPQTNAGSFLSSCWKLNKIFACAVNTVQCCSMDTYVDCPTYEQVLWSGDMRNEALCDWLINGKSELWKRSLLLSAQSLETSPIVTSHSPSGWSNIITAWACLWHRSVEEYLMHTGDFETGKELFAYALRDMEGMKRYINRDGLYEIESWNLFDWANMDTPKKGVVTHQNFLLLTAIDSTLRVAELIGAHRADAWLTKMRQELKTAINIHLWSEEEQAYADCLRYKNGKKELSLVFSQQTHVAALLSQGADGARLKRCEEIVFLGPENFVKSGSPFFEFFKLEILAKTGKFKQVFESLYKNWGFMIDMGCDTFWELWSGITLDGRMTRSHCHGWSSAPVFFLIEEILGVKPCAPGYKKVRICPHPVDLDFCRAVVPTPYGKIEVQWKAEHGKITQLKYDSPEEIEVEVDYES